jgi:uncharacterized protein
MIVDIHTHTPTHVHAVRPAERQPNTMWRSDRVVEAAVSWADYMAAMEPVDRACVFGIRLKGGEMPAGREGAGVQWVGNVNDQAAAFCRAYPDKLIGFMSVHPDEGDALQEVERCVKELGLRGSKLGPKYQGFDPLGTAAFQVYAAAQRPSLPIPELRVVMAHMGHPWHADTIAVIRKHPHVYADVSAQFFRPWSQYNCLRLATEWGVLDKLLFGSDYPVATPSEVMAGLVSAADVAERANLPPLDRQALQAIVERDSLALLGLT